MNRKRAAELKFKCPSCKEVLAKFGSHFGCGNPDCFQNYHQVAYRIKLGLIPKNRL